MFDDAYLMRDELMKFWYVRKFGPASHERGCLQVEHKVGFWRWEGDSQGWMWCMRLWWREESLDFMKRCGKRIKVYEFTYCS